MRSPKQASSRTSNPTSKRWWLPLLVAGLLGLGFARPSAAEARVGGEIAYSYQQTWQTTVRLVRVDLGCTITERDPDTGFILFEYVNQGRAYPGSIEVVQSTDSSGRERVRVNVQVSAMPSYVERMIFDRLTRKLREDFGDARREPERPSTRGSSAAPRGDSEPAARGDGASDADRSSDPSSSS